MRYWQRTADGRLFETKAKTLAGAVAEAQQDNIDYYRFAETTGNADYLNLIVLEVIDSQAHAHHNIDTEGSSVVAHGRRI